MTRHSLQTEDCIDGENDVNLVIVYDFIPGQPEQGPSYSSGGQPAEPADVDVISVLVNDEKADEAQFDYVVCSDRLWQKMVDHALDERE